MDELPQKVNQVIHVLDQSAAQHRDEGERRKAEADKALAESFARAGVRIGKVLDDIERRIQRNVERAKQGLPHLTLEEQLRLDKEEDAR
jgi:hypothetical protein